MILRDADFAGQEGATPGDYVATAVTDTGTGMDEATRARAFWFGMPRELVNEAAVKGADVPGMGALPQFLLAPVIGTLLRDVDARLLLALGFALVGAACLMCTGLTADWASADFLPSQIVQAVGQFFMLTSLVWFITRHLCRTDAFTFGSSLQTARLLSGELGSGLMQRAGLST